MLTADDAKKKRAVAAGDDIVPKREIAGATAEDPRKRDIVETMPEDAAEMVPADDSPEPEVIGSIDGISNNVLNGWLAHKDGSPYVGKLQLLCAGSRFTLPRLPFRERQDQSWAEGVPMKVGFSVELPPVFTIDQLRDVKIETEHGDQVQVWERCRPEQRVPPKPLIADRWEQLVDPFFVRNYISMPTDNPLSFLIYVLNDPENRPIDPLYILPGPASRRALIRAITESSPIELHLPLNPAIKAILNFTGQEHLASLDTRILLSVFRAALITNVFNVPFSYESYLEECGTEERRRIEEHCESTGFDRLYCAMVHHFHSACGRKIMDGFNRFPTSVVADDEAELTSAAAKVEQVEQFTPNAFKDYELGLRHYIGHGQFEPHRLLTLCPTPSFEVIAQITKLRRFEPEIPDPRGLPVSHWGLNRSKKVLGGASKIWRAQNEGRAVLPIFMPWFTYGGADKETLLLAQAVRDEFADQAEIIFILSAGGRGEEQLYKHRFNTLLLRTDEFTDHHHIDHAIQRIIATPNVRCVVNSNSLDFWNFFVKNSRLVEALTAVATMTFCDDLDSDTGSRDGWLRRFFKYVALQNSVLLADNAKHVSDFVADYRVDGMIKTRVLHYPVMPNRQKTRYEIDGRPRLLWASRLDEQKGIGTLTTVAQRMPECEFHVFGSHVLSKPDHSIDLLRSLNNVNMHEPYKDFDELEIESFDLFLYTSAWDGLPNILLEIGAAGLPIVSSMVGGIPELLDDKNAFPVADHSSASAFIEKIRDALANGDERRNKADSLYDTVSKRHSWPQFRQAIREIFGEFIL